MVAATLLYNGSATATTAIITALGTNAAANLIVVPNGGGQGVAIFLQGS
jgi:hypothetical protein